MRELTYQTKEELAVWERYPQLPQTVKLLDGTDVTVRSIHPDDAPRLQALFARLSRESIYLRFLQHRKALTHSEAVRLATVDCQTHVALVAVRAGTVDEKVIAVARYAVTQSDGSILAEPAIVVEDRYQGQGLGTLLLKWLVAHARSRHVRAFQTTVHPNNVQMMRFIEQSELPTKKIFESGRWEILVDL